MYYETIYVSNEDVARFMNEVKPQSASIDMSDSAEVAFEFTNAADFERAQKWQYAHYPMYWAHNPDNYIYFDIVKDSYGYCANGKVVTGFNNPIEAEEAYYSEVA